MMKSPLGIEFVGLAAFLVLLIVTQAPPFHLLILSQSAF